MTKLEVLFSPAEFAALAHSDVTQRDLAAAACVVFDILRATTCMITALAAGAEALIPVADIPEALRLKAQNPALLLAGEREGFRITARLAGGVEFDLGNSPREFTADKVRGRSIAMTTTNGTRALRACLSARETLPASFLNLTAVAAHLRSRKPSQIILVCSGTGENAAYEDTLAAGALAHSIWELFRPEEIADSAQIARNVYLSAQQDLAAAIRFASNGRRLLALPELRDDVAFCLQRDIHTLLARLEPDGRVRRFTPNDN